MLSFGFPDLQRKMLTHFPWFFLDFVKLSAGFLGISEVFVRFTHAFHVLFRCFFNGALWFFLESRPGCGLVPASALGFS